VRRTLKGFYHRPMAAAPDPQDTGSSVKETLLSLTISFVFAFVFRGFVVEAFMIPTGSMAPTLMGAHLRFQDPETGYNWPVGPWRVMDDGQTPHPQQGTRERPVSVHDPMSREPMGGTTGLVNVKPNAGDRIFVLKYLENIFEPNRFDVVVFKNPLRPDQNFIKRLIGVPGEQVALVDGDVFTRPASETGSGDAAASSWTGNAWKIQRKPEIVQRAVWQDVFDSAYTPIPSTSNTINRATFQSPWLGSGDAWDMSKPKAYRFGKSGAATLAWDHARLPIVDTYAYNQTPNNNPTMQYYRLFGALPDVDGFFQSNANGGLMTFVYPVSDIKISANIRPDAAGLKVAAVIDARGHQFRGRIEGTEAILEMSQGSSGTWNKLASATIASALQPGVATPVEFWHVDQSLALYVDGKRVAYATYDWTPDERLSNSIGTDSVKAGVWNIRQLNVLNDARKYSKAQARFEFSGSAFDLYHVAIARDIHYQAAIYSERNPETREAHTRAGLPALATNPSSTLTLGPGEYFCCGDNSPASSDGRLWDIPNPWVGKEFNPHPGIVDQRLMIGKAVLVYLPGIGRRGDIPMLDFGRMRWIW
jgi:signal peptidase I